MEILAGVVALCGIVAIVFDMAMLKVYSDFFRGKTSRIEKVVTDMVRESDKSSRKN